MTTNSRPVVGPDRLRASTALVTALVLLAACSGPGDAGPSDTSEPPTTSPPATTAGSDPITTDDPPPPTDASSTTTITVAPLPEVLSIENTMADPSAILFLDEQQRGLLPPGPDDTPSIGDPARPSTPCSFAWNRGRPSGGAGGDFAFIDIDACEFATIEEAAAYADAWRVTMSTPSRDGAVATALAPIGDWDGVRIDVPANEVDQMRVAIERVRQHGLRVYHVTALHEAAVPDPVGWADELVALQDARIVELDLGPDTAGIGYSDQIDRFTVDDVLLPWATLTAAKPIEAAAWDAEYRLAEAGDWSFVTEEGSRQVIFLDGSFLTNSVTRYDTPGDAQRALVALRDRYESSAGGGSIDGVADSIRFGALPIAAVVHGDRLYRIVGDSELLGPLMVQLDQHLRDLGLADGLTSDLSVPEPAEPADLAEASTQLAALFPPTVVTAAEVLQPQGVRVIDMRAIDWSTEPNSTTQRYGSVPRGTELTVVTDVAPERFANRFQPASGDVVDGWTVSVLTTLGTEGVGPDGERVPPVELVRYRRAKWFGTFGVVAVDAMPYPSLADIDTIAGGRRDEMLAGLDAWFGKVEIPSFLTSTHPIGDRLGMTRLCDAIRIDGIDASLSSLRATTVDRFEIDQRQPTGGVLRSPVPTDPAGTERVCANEIAPTAELPTGMRTDGFEFASAADAQAWLVATVGPAAPETLAGGLTATFADDGTTTTAALTSGRYGFVVATTLAGTVDGVSIDRNAFGRSVAAGLADRVALSGLA
jgi:hypothetical protein